MYFFKKIKFLFNYYYIPTGFYAISYIPLGYLTYILTTTGKYLF